MRPSFDCLGSTRLGRPPPLSKGKYPGQGLSSSVSTTFSFPHKTRYFPSKCDTYRLSKFWSDLVAMVTQRRGIKNLAICKINWECWREHISEKMLGCPVTGFILNSLDRGQPVYPMMHCFISTGIMLCSSQRCMHIIPSACAWLWEKLSSLV